MLIIPQAKPQTNFFKVFVPGNTQVKHHDKIECRDPDNGKTSTGECLSIITIGWHEVPQWICMETYGLKAYELREELARDIPDFKTQDNLKILIIKEN